MDSMIRCIRRFIAILLLAAAPAYAQAPAALPEIPLRIGSHTVTAEVAANDAQRTQGLMERRMLPDNRGMLFVFRETALLAFWMKNTYVPLSIAFLDEAGVIINIEHMKPLTTNPHPSARPARYALEVNQGWFEKRGIKPGMRVEGLEKAPAPR